MTKNIFIIANSPLLSNNTCVAFNSQNQKYNLFIFTEKNRKFKIESNYANIVSTSEEKSKFYRYSKYFLLFIF